ncbi:hypothetical protein [Miniimonas sp. S16]|uniref:hypothetical protein n=1 Tax=Miniimonas sp. S16 TaxID=2171623 RepID=UPI000D529C7F|nr:hypothetical protein [Miniimonas sp. S16]
MPSLGLSGGCALLLGGGSLPWRALTDARLVKPGGVLGWWSPGWPQPAAAFTVAALVAALVLLTLAVAIATSSPTRPHGLPEKE